MRPDPISGRTLPRLAVAFLGFASCWGCARERHQITPTTIGTDFKRMPRGKMTPFPWPGQDISRATPAPVDPQAALASGTP